MNPTEIPLMFYVAGAKETFSKCTDKQLEALAKEISALSLTVDISKPHGNYQRDMMKIAFERAVEWHDNKPFKHLSYAGNNQFNVKVGKAEKENVSPMQLMAIMTYCTNRVKGDKLKGMQGFEYLNMGLNL
jgi:hypothetical protein